MKCYVDDACLEVSAGEMLDFGEYYQSKPSPRKVILTNCTTYKYDVDIHHKSNDWLKVNPESFTLAPGEKKEVIVTPTTNSSGDYSSAVMILHDNTSTLLMSKMKILSDYDVLKELERTTRGELTLSNVDVASDNTLTLEITNPFEVGLHLSLETDDTWLSLDNENFVLPPNNSKTIRIKVDPKRLYSGGLSIESSIDLILGGSRKSFDISITTAQELPEIDGWHTQYGNNQNTNYADCTISETEPDEIWQVDLGYSEVVSQPIISKGRVYVGTADGVLHCLNASTGDKFWEFDTDKSINSMSIQGNSCYVTSSRAIFCLDTQSGVKKWSTSLDGRLSAPTVTESRVFVTVCLIAKELEDWSSKVVCFDSVNGKILWVRPIGYTSVKPAYYKGNLYLPGDTDFFSFDKDNTGRLYSINANNGSINWGVKGDYCSDYVAIYNDKLYTINLIYLESHNLKNGSLYWGGEESGLFGDFAIHDNTMIVGLWGTSEYYHLKIFDAITGKLKMRGEKDSQAVGTTIITNNAGLQLTMDGYLGVFPYKSSESYYWSKKITNPCYGDTPIDCDYNPKFSVASGYIFYGLEDGTVHCLGSQPEKKEYKSDKNLNRLTYQLDSKKYWSYKPGSSETEHELSAAPQILSGSSYLPAKYVVESLGGTVSWNGDERKVICKLGSTTIELWIGKKQAKVNGVTKNYDSAGKLFPQIVDGRTMVPMRFLAENLGCQVHWIASEKGIVITRQ